MSNYDLTSDLSSLVVLAVLAWTVLAVAVLVLNHGAARARSIERPTDTTSEETDK
jgi:hypothetical protein